MNTQLVLIDTWWNVNLQKSSSELPIYRFNRYMVECEYGIGRDVVVYQLVLIDTWWNVNFIYATIRKTDILVLIDTWWNVNRMIYISRFGQGIGFNRYMVECEFHSALGMLEPVNSFNRYMVECE